VSSKYFRNPLDSVLLAFAVVLTEFFRLNEGLQLQVADIDKTRQRVHIRDSKGNKDRFVPLAKNTLDVLRRFWSLHKHPLFIFPNRKFTLT